MVYQKVTSTLNKLIKSIVTNMVFLSYIIYLKLMIWLGKLAKKINIMSRVKSTNQSKETFRWQIKSVLMQQP